MVFSSLTFLCIFLPAVFILYNLIPNIKAKNILLVIFSFIFYAYGEPIYVLLMFGSTILNYLLGLAAGSSNIKVKKTSLITAVIINIGLLGVFKYTDLIIDSLNRTFSMSIALTGIELPIGISFFTFQALSYVIDVYRGDVEKQKSCLNVMLYISFFPQLIAGPIIKYHDIEKQLYDRKTNLKDISAGLVRFIIGLAKKVLIANTVAIAVDAIFALSPIDINLPTAWIAAIAYMIQIYYDFSGYSDMAIGLGRMFGFTFKENFNYPYSAVSIKDFWRRWHISLSTWFKEYLYIPLGGNRKGKARTILNKFIVFFTTGLWHGANYTFIIWGLYHGAFLTLEQAAPIKKLKRILGHIYTWFVVCIGFVIFRSDTLIQSGEMIKQMFAGFNFSRSTASLGLEQLTPSFIIMLALGIFFAFPVLPKLKEIFNEKNNRTKRNLGILTYITSALLLCVCMLRLSSGTYNPFIYFRF